MKVIVSHDVDHIKVFEHKNDLIIPKFFIRTFIELGLGYISHQELKFRLLDFINNKWNNIKELMKFDKENSIPATFFIGVSKGGGLSYSLIDAETLIKRIIQEGFRVGIHGVSFDNFDKMKLEYEKFKKISGLDKFGIRIHNLNTNSKTFEMLEKIGYLYDSSSYGIKNPFKAGNLWEFYVCLMDVYLVSTNSKYQNRTLKQIKDATKRCLDKAFNKNILYFTILFHDRYFSDSFKTLKEWYIWLIEYLIKNKFAFISFEEAMEELKNKEMQYLHEQK